MFFLIDEAWRHSEKFVISNFMPLLTHSWKSNVALSRYTISSHKQCREFTQLHNKPAFPFGMIFFLFQTGALGSELAWELIWLKLTRWKLSFPSFQIYEKTFNEILCQKKKEKAAITINFKGGKKKLLKLSKTFLFAIKNCRDNSKALECQTIRIKF